MTNSTTNTDMVFLHKQWDQQLFEYQINNSSLYMMPKPPSGSQFPFFAEYLSKKKVDVVVSLLSFEEMNSFSLVEEGSECERHGIEFVNFSIKDHSTPQFFVPFNQLIENLVYDFKSGKNIAIHCFAGIGRTGIVAASMLIKMGYQVDMALIELSQARGLKMPETIEQISWLHRYAEELQNQSQGL
ncbi:MAG TPA: dual specificity protein phosphatase family protein [Gammaproteobacteria bacterium]|nr:dual specificity protein phosphatase family protein [Xanthomonadales bacterium]HOP21538.1 dual specificity protein phosphatase family protein [Gammaproteobacteria bacterium]HPQ86292.1 dual specificity protein phosphatase family protein [Gammaproteobacteria bacterium]